MSEETVLDISPDDNHVVISKQFAPSMKYKCIKHGIVIDETVNITLESGMEGTFCLRCLIEHLKQTIGTVTRIEEDYGGR